MRKVRPFVRVSGEGRVPGGDREGGGRIGRSLWALFAAFALGLSAGILVLGARLAEADSYAHDLEDILAERCDGSRFLTVPDRTELDFRGEGARYGIYEEDLRCQ